MSAVTDCVEVIPLGLIHVSQEFQPRCEGLDSSHVALLQEMAEQWTPLVAVRQNTTTILVDGFHRYAAAQNLGLAKIPVRIVDFPVDGDVVGLAFSLNLGHGRPLTLNDRRFEAARQLRRDPHVSDREVGRRCGLSQPTVAKVRASLEVGAQIERTTERVGKGGYEYTHEGKADLTEEQVETMRLAKYVIRLAKVLQQADELTLWTTPREIAGVLESCIDEAGQDTLCSRIIYKCHDLLAVFKALNFDVRP